MTLPSTAKDHFISLTLPAGLRRFFIYGLVGVLATGVDWALFWTTNTLLGVHYEIAVFCSFTAGSVVNYTLNRILTFRSKKALASSLAYFTVISLLSLGCSLSLMYVLVTLLGLGRISFLGLSGAFLARMTTTGLMYVVNFFAHSAFTFKEN